MSGLLIRPGPNKRERKEKRDLGVDGVAILEVGTFGHILL